MRTATRSILVVDPLRDVWALVMIFDWIGEEILGRG
jgi:hypothetical protein